MSLSSSLWDYYEEFSFSSWRDLALTPISLCCVSMPLPRLWPFSRAAEYDDLDHELSYGTSNAGYQRNDVWTSSSGDPHSALRGAALPTAKPIFDSYSARVAANGLTGHSAGDYSAASSTTPFAHTVSYSTKHRIDEELKTDRLIRNDLDLDFEDEFASTLERKVAKSKASKSKSVEKEKKKKKKSKSKAKSSSSPTPPPASESVPQHRDEDASSGDESESDNELLVESKTRPTVRTNASDEHESALPAASASEQ